MRKITRDACHAFNNFTPFKRDNTEVRVDFDHTGTVRAAVLLLHGNEIARRHWDGPLYITDAGWQTPTTKERLNGISSRVRVSQRKGQWYLNDVPWDGDWWMIGNDFEVVERGGVIAVHWPWFKLAEPVKFKTREAAQAFITLQTAVA